MTVVSLPVEQSHLEELSACALSLYPGLSAVSAVTELDRPLVLSLKQAQEVLQSALWCPFPLGF